MVRINPQITNSDGESSSKVGELIDNAHLDVKSKIAAIDEKAKTMAGGMTVRFLSSNLRSYQSSLQMFSALNGKMSDGENYLEQKSEMVTRKKKKFGVSYGSEVSENKWKEFKQEDFDTDAVQRDQSLESMKGKRAAYNNSVMSVLVPDPENANTRVPSLNAGQNKVLNAIVNDLLGGLQDDPNAGAIRAKIANLIKDADPAVIQTFVSKAKDLKKEARKLRREAQGRFNFSTNMANSARGIWRLLFRNSKFQQRIQGPHTAKGHALESQALELDVQKEAALQDLFIAITNPEIQAIQAQQDAARKNQSNGDLLGDLGLNLNNSNMLA